MKNVKILRALIGLFVAANSIAILLNLFVLLEMTPELNNRDTFVPFMIILKELIREALLLVPLVILFQAMRYFVRHGHFNMRSARMLKLSGIILMMAAVAEYFTLRVLRTFYLKVSGIEYSYSTRLIEGLPMLFTLLLVGFGLYTLSDFIRKGEAITRENELTI